MQRPESRTKLPRGPAGSGRETGGFGMFIFGNEHTATVTGTAVKEVTCEACGTRYSYLATRTATGKAFAPYFLFESHAAGSAEKQAKAEAQKLLGPACDPVPCPSCGLI